MDETEEAYVDFLKSRDIVGIPSEVVEKFIVILKQKDAEIQDEKVENEKLRVFNEQQNFAIEKELQDTVKKLNEMQLKKQQDESKLVDFELRASESTESLADIKTKNSVLASQLDTLKTLNDDLAAEKNNLIQIVERCNTKIDDLNAEVRALSQKLSDTNRSKCEAMLKLDDALGNEAVCQSKVRHLEQEKDRLAKIIDNLNNELTQATQTIFSARTEQSHKILDLQAKLTNSEDQGRIDKESKETLQSALEERDKKIDNLISQLKDQRDLNIQSESQFSHELRSQVKLANLYKASLDESQGRVKDVLTAGEEMQSLLKQSVDDNKLLKETNERQKQEFDANILELTEKISKLENELVNANDLLSQCRKQVFDVDTLSPAAAAASKLLKSGKSLTEIYTEYITLSNELEEEKETNSKLNLYLEQILKEVEEKAPYFHKQRENLEKSLETIDILSQELQKLKTEKEYLETCNLENSRKGKVLLGELEVSEKSKSDLGRQVSHLLKEIEILKGRRINATDDEIGESADVSHADSIISENLLYFKDVVELQQQNQKLLAVLRDLSESRQEEENEIYEKKMTELKSELESALEQIAELRDARNKQDEVVTSIARQRDMYRLMATPNAKAENENELESSPVRNNTTISLKSPIIADNDASNLLAVHLQEELSAYKSETKQQIQNLNEQIEKFKDEKIEIHLQNSKISSQLQFSDDRYKNLSCTIEGYKKEISALSARNERLSSMSAKHEEISCSLKNDVMALQEKLSRSESELINIRREKSLIQQSEAHLKGEIETLKQERSGQTALLINLQTIQKSFEAQDNDWRTLLKNRITALEKEVSNLQSKLDLENVRSREAAIAWEKVRQDLNQAINEQIIKLNQTREDLDRANAVINDLKIERATLETTLKNRDGQLDTVTVSGDLTPKRITSENDDSLNLQLLEARSTINSLREQLKRVNDHLINLKAMSSSLEGELAEQNKVSKIFKEEAEQMLKSKVSAIADLEQELNLIKKENETLVKERNDIIMKNLSENAEVQANLNNATSELNNLKFVTENLKKGEEDAKEEIENQRKLLEEIRNNYEKEMTEHTSVLKKLEELQLKYEEISNKCKIAEDSAQKADYLLEVTNSTWQDKETTLNEEKKRMSTEIEELHTQNQNLLELLDRLKAQVIVFQNRNEQGDALNVDLNKEHSEEHMFDVIKYLRKEKELAVAKSEVVVAESSRLTTKIEFLEKRLQETNKMLQESQAKEQISVTSAVQHAELLRKVELLNVLTDGNRVLRAEKTEMQKQLKDLEVKAAEFEKELTLIRSSQLTLVAQRDSLQVERKGLESESRRWQLRAQHLVEQSSKMNAEEHKKSLLERESFEKQLSTLKEELTRVRASLSLSENSLTTAQKDLELLRSSTDVAAKDSQISDLNNSLLQVRKIARKYKLQFDELKLQNDKLKSENEQMVTQASKVPETETISQANVAEAVELAKQELKKEFDVKIKEAEDSVKSSDEKVKKIRQTAVQRIATLTTSKDEQQREFEEWKSKYSQLETAKNDEAVRLINMNTELESSITILKNDLAALRVNLTASSKEKSVLQKEIDELNSKLSMQQKQLESLQKQLKDALKMPTASLSRDSSILAQSSSDVVNPPTANIKPMATPSSSVVRHPHPSSGSSSRLTPMGRIRPITAVSPASSRTVAVPPTSASSSSITHSQQDSPDDGHPTPSTGVSSTSNVPQATVAPTQAVLKHAVVASVQQMPIAHQSSSLSEDIVSATNIGLNAVESFGSEGFEAELGESSSVSTDNEMQKKNRDVESSSTDGLSSTTDSMKRSRDDAEIDSSSEALVERSPRKRPRKEDSRTADSFQSHANASESIIQHRGTVAQVQATTSQAIITPSIEDSNNDDANEIIVLVSDDDESVASEVKRSDLESGAVEDDDDDVEYAEDEEEIDEDEEFQEEGGPDVEEEEQSREQQYPDDNEIVIIDDPESVTRSNEGEQPGEASESIVVPSQNRRYGYRFPIRSERLPSVGRTVPCSSIGPPTGCEDGDSIVPSTPTLFDSRRNDGFSEAISSPQVPSETFLFGNSEQPSQLASQALAMDDTRMDLTQFDDATGRSVPSTPLQVSPLDALAPEIISDMLPDTSNASSSSHPQHSDQTTPIVPKITVTGLDENTFTIDEDVQEITEESDNQAFEEPTAVTSNEEVSAADDATEIITLDTSKEEANQNETDNDRTADNFELDGTASNSQANDGNQQSQEQQAQRRTTPIVWDEPVSSRRGNVAVRASPVTRSAPGRGFARRSRPIARPGPARGGAFTYYRETMDPTSQNRPGNARGPRMGGPPGRGRPFARRAR